MQKNPLVTIAFVYRERLNSTVSCLKHLLDTTTGDYELICVDGGAPESIASDLRALAADYGFTLIRSDDYLSPNESRNLALEHVKTRYVVFVDNDVEVGDDWLEPLVRCAEETGAWLVGPLYMQSLRGEERIHMFGGVIRLEDEQGRPVYFEKHQLQHNSPGAGASLDRQPTGLIEFHTVLMAMDAYRALGPLDERLFNCAEHADLSLAVLNAGKQIYLEPSSVITYQIPDHLESIDKDFFALRWSEAWTQATLDRLAEKYAIPIDEQGLLQMGVWVRLHRQRVLAEWPGIRRWFGKSLHDKFKRRISKPLEKRLNLRDYPPTEYVENRKIEAAAISG